MKIILGILALITCFDTFALGALPNGKWVGEGRYQNESGEKGRYQEILTVKDNVTTSQLTFGGQTATYVMKFDFRANDFVVLAIEDKQTGASYAGSGYCASVWCHVQADHANKFEMTIVFEGDQVFELGSDVENGKRGWFESVLKKSL